MLFCVYSLSILWLEQYEVTYRLDDEQQSNSIRYLSCVPLKQVYPNESEITLDQMRDDLYEHLNKMPSKRRHSALEESEEERFIRNATESRNYFVLADSLCFVCEDVEKLNKASFFFNYVNVTMFAQDERSAQLVRIKKPCDLINQLIVIYEDYPFSACRDRSYSRFRCLNKCFTAKNRLSKYYYAGDEAAVVRLDYRENESIATHERRCLSDQCEADSCRLSYFISAGDNYYSKPSGRMHLKIKTFRAQRMMHSFDFSLQQMGLVCLLVGCSVRQLSLKLLKGVCLKIRRRIRINPVQANDQTKDQPTKQTRTESLLLNLLVLLICLLCSTYLYVHLFREYHTRQNSPIRKEITYRLMRPETIHLAVCVNLQNIAPKRDASYLRSLTLSQLEALTDLNGDQIVDEIYLNYQNKRTSVHWRLVNTSAMFLHKDRCFRLVVYPAISEPHYQMVMGISKLTMKFKNLPRLYLLTENEQLNSKSHFLEGFHEFYRAETRLSKSGNKCVDYERLYANCNNRASCLDRCVNRLSVEKHGHLSSWYGFVVHKSEFNESEWNSLRIKSGYFEYSSLMTECKKMIVKKQACHEIRFEKGLESDHFSGDVMNIELYYEVRLYYEEEPSWYLLVLDILNIQTIFYQSNAFAILMLIHSFARANFKLTNDREPNRLFFIYLLCSVGFGYHAFHILSITLHDSLVFSQHFEIFHSKQMPVIVFCFQIDETQIDKKRKLTGNYLQELTSELRPDRVFQNVSYLDERSNWVTLDHESDFRDEHFEIETFFFLRKKCFGLMLNRSYPNDQFYFFFDRSVLQVHFERSFVAATKPIAHFMTKVRDSMHFSRVAPLKLFRYQHAAIFSIVHSTILVRCEDKFAKIKNFFQSPLSLLYGVNDLHDAKGYLRRLLSNFRLASDNRVTSNLPITKKLFSFEIDDEAFDRYYHDVQNLSDRSSPASSNYEREFAVNSFTRSQRLSADHPGLNSPYFEFAVDYLVKVIVATNEQNYASLILNLLNVLSIWFSLGILDLYACLLRIKRLFLC